MEFKLSIKVSTIFNIILMLFNHPKDPVV